MRIRRNAAKILGTAASPLSWFSPPPPPPAVEATKAVAVCQLNCSPWDSTSFVPPKEEDEGIVGNEIKREEPIYLTDSVEVLIKKVENKMDEDEREKTSDTKKKKRRKDDLLVEEEIESNGAVKSISISSTCKKTDSKLLRCKRRAQNPDTFCHYHLTQRQSYSYTKPRKVTAPKCRPTKKKKKKKKKKKTTKITAASVGSDSNFYYYYKFGPCRAKRSGSDSIDDGRGGDDIGSNSSNGGVEEEGEDGAEERSGLSHCLVAPAGCDDVDDSVVEEEEDHTVEKELIGGEEREKGKREAVRGNLKKKKKKRGRKPVKARSLKSLM